MKFCWVTITVANLDESIAFYRDIVGLDLAQRFSAGPHGEIAFMGNGETQVELIQDGNAPDIGGGVSFGFTVDSVDKKMAFLEEKGVAITGGPFSPNPHVRFFYVKDPNGLNIQLVENL